MNRIGRIRPIRRLTSVLTVLAGALIASAAAVPAAFAVRAPLGGGQDGPASAPPPVHTLIAGGMPGPADHPHRSRGRGPRRRRGRAL